MSDNNTGIWFQSAVSGLWYEEPLAAGTISAIKIDGVAYSRPNGKAPTISEAEVVEAIADMREGRQSHLAWAAHLRQPHTFECQGCVDHAAHVGDVDHHDEWVAKYDRAIRLLESLQSSPVGKQRCELCGHNKVGLMSGFCIQDMPDADGDLKGGHLCGCKCEFPSTEAVKLMGIKATLLTALQSASILQYGPKRRVEIQSETSREAEQIYTLLYDLKTSIATAGGDKCEFSVGKARIELDPLEFWADLAEVLGHERPAKASPPALIVEIQERLQLVSVGKEAGEQREAFAKAAFDAVMAVESSVYNYSPLQKAAQVAAMVRGGNIATSPVPASEPEGPPQCAECGHSYIGDTDTSDCKVKPYAPDDPTICGCENSFHEFHYDAAPSVAEGDESELERVLSLLISYGAIHTVEGVKYPDGAHAEALAAAERIRDRLRHTRATPSPVDHEKQAREIVDDLIAADSHVYIPQSLYEPFVNRVTTALQASAGVDPRPSLQSIYQAVEDALNSYRMHYTRELPDLDNGLSLVDRLSPDADKDVTRGREELDLLIDYVCGAVGDLFRSAAPTPSEAAQLAASAIVAQLKKAYGTGYQFTKKFEQDVAEIISRYCGTGEMK